MADLMTIIIDTREQNPLPFSLMAERVTLATGDYPVKGLERFVAVERKSRDDLSCIDRSRGRG